MKALPILFTLLFSIILSIAQTNFKNDTRDFHQESDRSQTTRGLLPNLTPVKLFIHSPQPQIASDHSALEIISPDYEEFHLKIFVHLEDRLVMKKTIWLVPGQQKIPLPLYELEEGAYTLAIYREKEALTYKYFEIVR